MSSKSTKSRERRGSGGFSLIEVIVALAILGIALVSLVELFSVSLRSTKKSADYTTALIYARSIMEEAYAAPSPEDMGDTFDLGEGYSGERAVREVELPWSGEEEGEGNGEGGGDAPPFKLFEITVTVTWPPGGKVVLTGRRAVYDETS
jgi:prepilin-type N-terminal cleavage/methylation domain-containing protein